MGENVEIRILEGLRADTSGATPRLVGTAIVYGQPSRELGSGEFKFREVIVSGAVRYDDLVMLHGHDPLRVLGRESARTLRVQGDAQGLHFELDPPRSAADLVESVQRGDLTGVSFAFSDARDTWDERTTPPTRTIHSMRVQELSLTAFPAYEATHVAVARRSLDQHRQTSAPKETPVETAPTVTMTDAVPPVPPIPPESRGRRDVEIVGEERILKPADSFRSWMEKSGSADLAYRPLTFGAFLRSMITGPKNDIERRALAEGADATGGITVPDLTLSRFIDRLRAAMVTMRAGAVTIPLTSDKTTIAKLTGDVTIGWRNENAEITAADPTFGSVVFTPRSLAALVRVSRELVEDSLNVEQMLERSFAETMAREVDRVCLIGTGIAPQPLGIAATPNINTVAVGAAITSYDTFIDGLYLNWVDNVPDTTAIVMHPRTYATLQKFKMATELAPLPPPPVIGAIPIYQTTALPINQAPGTATTVIAGDFSRLLVGVRNSMRLEILRERYGEFLQLGFLAHLRMDVAVEHPESFVTWTGIVP